MAIETKNIMEKKKVLTLTLKEPYYSMTGEVGKDYEIRADSKWIRSRLIDKDGYFRRYDEVLLINGYGATRPRKTRQYAHTIFIQSAGTYFLPNGQEYVEPEPHWLIIMNPPK